MGKTLVVCAVEDTGPARNVALVVRRLKERGVMVRAFARGLAQETFSQMGLEHEEYTSARSVLEIGPDLVLGAIDSSCESPPAAEIAAMGLSIPLILVSDFWGAALAKLDSWRSISAAWLCVGDPEDAELTARAFPLVPREHIVITGRPALDEYAGHPVGWVADLGATARVGMDIGAKSFVVLFAGQFARTGEVFEELVNALLKIGEDAVLIGRKHPRMARKEWAAEATRWDAMAARLKGSCVRYLDRTGPDYDPTALIAASNVVTTMFSTVGVDAAVMRVPPVAILFQGVGQAEWERVEPEVPMFQPVTLGACALVRSRLELITRLREARSGELGRALLPAQERHFCTDGGNARRVADVVIGLLGG